MTAAGSAAASDNFAHACCGRWAADRSRFALYCSDAAGNDSAWTFWDIQREANRFSNVLAAQGVMRGDRVAVMLPQRAETAALLVACWQMGAIAVPLPARGDTATLADALARAEARVAVVDSISQAALAVAASKAPRHAIAVGGAPLHGARDWNALRPLASARYAPLAGVGDAAAVDFAGKEQFAHAELAQCTLEFLSLHIGYPQAGDLFWSPADWATPAGLLEGLLPAWSRGQPVVASDGAFDAQQAFALIDKYDVRNARLMPDQLEAMMAGVPKPNDKYDCRLRTLSTGGMAPTERLSAWLAAELGIGRAA